MRGRAPSVFPSIMCGYLRFKPCILSTCTFFQATVIQTAIRGWLERKRFQRALHSVVISQGAVRRFLARRQLKALKREARSVEHQKKLNKGLENKIISLQQKVNELQKDLASHKPLVHEIEDLKAKVETLKNTETELKQSKIIMSEKDDKIEKLLASLNEEKGRLDELLNEKTVYEKRCDELETSKKNLEEELQELKKKIAVDKEDMESKLLFHD